MSTRMDRGDGLVFLVEDDTDTRTIIQRWLESDGFEVESFPDAESCLSALSEHSVEAICLDVMLPGIGGLDTLQRIRERLPEVPVIMLTADREVSTIVEAMRAGAYDYLTKPVDRARVRTVLRNAVERCRMATRIRKLERQASGTRYPAIVGRSVAIQSVFDQLDQLGTSDINVLVLGESGTGKEMVANAIHATSPRAKGPFVAVNCAAIPESLMESEFFGHERGAFTGATERRAGRFEQASGGTLFLDEIGELSAALQAKLLRVVQERKFQRVGGSTEIRSDFRLVTATHRDLAAKVREHQFREDLFFRIAVFELEIPPLRERAGDITLLAQRFVERLAEGRALEIAQATLDVLEGYAWPGNVRELHNVMQRAVVVARGSSILPEHLPSKLCAPASGSSPDLRAALPQRARLEDLERDALKRALERHEGNIAEVVRELGIGRTTVYRKLKKFQLR